jgi:hypothetical protein
MTLRTLESITGKKSYEEEDEHILISKTGETYHWMSIDILIRPKSCIKKALLQPCRLRESIIVSNRPAISIKVLRADSWRKIHVIHRLNSPQGVSHTNFSSKFDNSFVSSDGLLRHDEFLHRNLRLNPDREFGHLLHGPF